MQYAIAVLLIIASLHFVGEYIFFQWFLAVPALGVVALPCAFYAWLKKSRIKTVVIVGLYYLMCNMAYVSFFRLNRYAANPSSTKALLAFFSLDQFFAVVFILGVLSLIKSYKTVLGAIGIWCLVNSIYTIHGAIEGDGLLWWGLGYSGFLNYASVNACVIAVTIPFLPRIKTKWRIRWGLVAHALAITACILSKSSLPIGTLIVVYATMAAMGLATRPNVLKVIGVIYGCASAVLAVNLYFDPAFFDSGFRLQAYKVFFKYWFHNANMFFGFGPGTHWPLAPSIQAESGFMVSREPNGFSHFWLQAHNEYLQVLTEHGAVGLVLTVVLVLMCTYQFSKHRKGNELASLFGLAACSLFNFPLRYFIGAFIAGTLLTTASRLEEESHAASNAMDG